MQTREKKMSMKATMLDMACLWARAAMPVEMKERTRRGTAMRERKITRFLGLVRMGASRRVSNGGREMAYFGLRFSFPKCDDSPYHDLNGRAKVKHQICEIQIPLCFG